MSEEMEQRCQKFKQWGIKYNTSDAMNGQIKSDATNVGNYAFSLALAIVMDLTLTNDFH